MWSALLLLPLLAARLRCHWASDRRMAHVYGAGAGPAADSRLVLRDRVDVGLGLRRTLTPNLAALLENSTVYEVGHRTPQLDPARPLEVLAGTQVRWGRIRITVGLRYHGHDLPSGRVRPAPLAGAVDLTDVGGADLAAHLEGLGASPAGPSHVPDPVRAPAWVRHALGVGLLRTPRTA